jgi:hypothetical protein
MDLSTLEEMVLVDCGQNCTTIASKEGPALAGLCNRIRDERVHVNGTGQAQRLSRALTAAGTQYGN